MKPIFGKLALGLALTLAVVATGWGQQNNTQPFKLNVIPPSPNAAALGKYGEIPVSYYTGVPNISIPIYEIKTRDLSLPISLSSNPKRN
jgi:hypothetical protein